MHDRADAGPPLSDNGYTHRQILVIFSGLLLGMLLAALDQTIVATSLRTITDDLGAPEHLAWVVTAYLLTTTVSTPLYGKLGDLFGRKKLFQVAIVVFTVGSVLCGIAGSMTQLIAFRAFQGLGAGGLIVLGQAIIAEVVTPRERGRYQGYFGAFFGASSVAGPLLGGFITDNLTWRWVFMINVPLGLLALVVTTAVLPVGVRRASVSIDYAGAAALTGAISLLILLTTWGGNEVAWVSPTMALLVAGVVVLGAGFVAIERRAADPILPLRLFRMRTFVLSGAIAMLFGIAMIVVVTFLPVFLQTVNGASATDAGLLLVPLMVGVLGASVFAGRRVTRTGRYRRFPIAGGVLVTIGLLLLTTLDATTSRLESGIYMAIVGVGLGSAAQIVVLATQNAVGLDDLGVATSSINFFRAIGGSLGVAMFAAVFNARITEAVAGGRLLGDQEIDALAAGARADYLDGFSGALAGTFVWALPVAVVAFGLALALRELPLRGGPGSGEAPPEADRPLVLDHV
jgi:EmrB/QacA subfamily drug resistance transporter